MGVGGVGAERWLCPADALPIQRRVWPSVRARGKHPTRIIGIPHVTPTSPSKKFCEFAAWKHTHDTHDKKEVFFHVICYSVAVRRPASARVGAHEHTSTSVENSERSRLETDPQCW